MIAMKIDFKIIADKLILGSTDINTNCFNDYVYYLYAVAKLSFNFDHAWYLGISYGLLQWVKW